MQINPEPRLAEIGGKAYELHRLQRFCAVPPFFVVVFDNEGEIDSISVQRAIREYSGSKGFELMAVRSSASLEDSVDASFAGVFESVLGVTSPDLIEATKRVVRSLHSERVTSYIEAKGIDPHGLRMAVIVQRLIHSRISGVCLTRFRNAGRAMLVEGCLGLGETLVSGTSAPDRYFIDRQTLQITMESFGYQMTALLAPQDDARHVINVEIPFHKRGARKLTRGEVLRVAETCLRVEERLSFAAADVEWAFEGGQLFVLQARPFSGLSRAKTSNIG